MSSYIPPQVAETEMTRTIVAAGLKLHSQGKVRDTFELPDYPELLLQVATNRLSIYDFVLGGYVPLKGAVLTATTIFWLQDVLGQHCDHHLVACGSGIDRYLPESLRGNPELQKVALVVRRIEILPYEGVVRGYLTGSAWKDYKNSRPVCGHHLPSGLHDGIKLPEPIFTPTTKAQKGHDESIDIREFRRERLAPGLEEACLLLYSKAAEYAQARGIIVADTKFEMGWLVPSGLWLGDEVLTPDSSRFWDFSTWEQAQSQTPPKSPEGFDKQYARIYGAGVETPFGVTGINNLDTKIHDHRVWVGTQPIPEEVAQKTSELYLGLLPRLTGMALADFWTKRMGITA